MRFDIRYACRFTYDQLVRESQNELRACPLSDEFQHLTSYRVQTVPSSRVMSFHDWWGTRVDAFGVREPHLVLDVVAEAVVETYPRPMLVTDPRASLLTDRGFRDQHAEFLERTRHANWGPVVAEAAAKQVEIAGLGVVSQVLGLHRFVGSQLRYETGSTYVGVDVDEVFDRGAGVCQDFAHLAVALARSVGIPARYVSGYLFSADDATAERTDQPVVHVQTHAWIEAAIPGAGWFPLDPTNGRKVGELHVKVGHGRDYDDVSPFRGVHQGVASASLEAAVEIRKGEPMLPGGLFSMLDATWGDTPGTPLRVTLGARTPIAMPALDQETQQQQQQQQ
jgi:transglutaminase-like putative cysteine protease